MSRNGGSGRTWRHSSRKFHTKHPERGRSGYSRKHKARTADHYGTFKEGVRQTPDRLNT